MQQGPPQHSLSFIHSILIIWGPDYKPPYLDCVGGRDFHTLVIQHFWTSVKNISQKSIDIPVFIDPFIVLRLCPIISIKSHCKLRSLYIAKPYIPLYWIDPNSTYSMLLSRYIRLRISDAWKISLSHPKIDMVSINRPGSIGWRFLPWRKVNPFSQSQYQSIHLAKLDTWSSVPSFFLLPYTLLFPCLVTLYPSSLSFLPPALYEDSL